MRKLSIRRDNFPSAIFAVEKLVRDNYKELFKGFTEELEESAARIEEEAKELCPVYVRSGNTRYRDPSVVPGSLRDSIKVEVSRSHRYPGIRASASAKNSGDHFDYALIQETDVGFAHETGQAHYLAQPFYEEISLYFPQEPEFDMSDYDTDRDANRY